MVDYADEDDVNKILEQYLFKPSNTSGSLFVKIVPDDEILQFAKTDQPNQYKAHLSIENINSQSLVAFYVPSLIRSTPHPSSHGKLFHRGASYCQRRLSKSKSKL
jgi:hypothetical protein